jgi:hypothetical protein
MDFFFIAISFTGAKKRSRRGGTEVDQGHPPALGANQQAADAARPAAGGQAGEALARRRQQRVAARPIANALIARHDQADVPGHRRLPVLDAGADDQGQMGAEQQFDFDRRSRRGPVTINAAARGAMDACCSHARC